MQVLGARGAVGKDALLERMNALDIKLQVFDAGAIFGREHLESAYEHAVRSHERGENLSQDLAVEVVLYAAGQRQIKSAMERVGIREDTIGFAVMLLEDGEPDTVLSGLGLERDDSLLDEGKDPSRFGFSDEEIGVLGEDRVKELVLEWVAMLDVGK